MNELLCKSEIVEVRNNLCKVISCEVFIYRDILRPSKVVQDPDGVNFYFSEEETVITWPVRHFWVTSEHELPSHLLFFRILQHDSPVSIQHDFIADRALGVNIYAFTVVSLSESNAHRHAVIRHEIYCSYRHGTLVHVGDSRTSLNTISYRNAVSKGVTICGVPSRESGQHCPVQCMNQVPGNPSELIMRRRRDGSGGCDVTLR